MYINHLATPDAKVQNFSFHGYEQKVNQGRVINFEGWKMFCDRFEVQNASGEVVPFTTGEFLLLRSLAYSSGRVLSRDQLLNWTRGEEYIAFDRAIDVQIGRLRKKLGDNCQHPQFIKTIRDIGYMFLPTVTYENFN